MNRRRFGAAIAALGVTAAGPASGFVHAEKIQLSRNGWMPNNEHLPVLIYRRAFQLSELVPERMEETFERNAWPAQWRNGIYDFHHYHSTAHEVLGFASGKGLVVLGGEGGQTVSVEAGDIFVLPAGTGHCRLSSDDHFLVIGAYPRGQHWDICRSAPDEEARSRMSQLPFPPSDPVFGAARELRKIWRPQLLKGPS